jgi:hypothetical protein
MVPRTKLGEIGKKHKFLQQIMEKSVKCQKYLCALSSTDASNFNRLYLAA